MTKRTKPEGLIHAFETALAAEPVAEHYLLKLFITGTTPKCTRAIQNIRAICDENLAGDYSLEVIDIYQHPEQARPEEIVATPTLVKKLPLPERKLVGDLSQRERVLESLDIRRRPTLLKPKKEKYDS